MNLPGKHRRVGLIGYQIRHSISPVFQQAAFDHFSLPITYELWETPPELIGGLGDRLRRDDTLGANVTIPHKQVVIPFLNSVDASADGVGAVNTIVHRGSRLVGYNTDVTGFSQSLRLDGSFELGGCKVVILGAGGAARAIVAACRVERSASVVVCSRRTEQAEGLVSDIQRRATGKARGNLTAGPVDGRGYPRFEHIRTADLLVNATPVGTRHHPASSELPVPVDALHDGLFVVDLIYNPPETPLLRECRRRGIRHLNGLSMLVYQGAAAFELWTGRTAPIEAMRNAAREALSV